MQLTLKALNDDATLNNWADIGAVSVVQGSSATVNLLLFQVARKIRYVPLVSATISVSLLKNDGTSLSKTATFPFADDRSIIQFSLTASETAALISQNLIVSIVESGATSIAVLQYGFQIVPTSQTGC